MNNNIFTKWAQVITIGLWLIVIIILINYRPQSTVELDITTETNDTTEVESESYVYTPRSVSPVIVAEKVEILKSSYMESSSDIQENSEEPTEEIVEEIPKQTYSDDDLKRLSRLIYFEVGNQSRKSKLYCGSVVLNHVASKDYPNTIKGAINKNHFSVAGYYMTRKVDKKLYAECEDVAKYLLENGSVLPKNVVGMSHYGTYKKWGKKLYAKIGKVYYFTVK